MDRDQMFEKAASVVLLNTAFVADMPGIFTLVLQTILVMSTFSFSLIEIK
jgi:hypothetical protein